MVDKGTVGEKVMAFVTMIFAYMVIAGVIAMVIGLIVLIISLIRRHRAKVRGETPKKFGLITGWILFLLPIFVVISFIVYWFV